MLMAGGLAVSASLWGAIFRRIDRIRRAVLYLDSDTALPPPPEPAPLVSILVPARNEERDLAATLRALKAQDYPRTEIIVIDDGSTDGTAGLAERELGGVPDARILRGGNRPSPDWVGKSWALDQAVREARGSYLFFSDADVVHHPAALRQAMAELCSLNVEAVSIMPSIDCRSAGEKMVMPLFALLSGLMQALDKTNDAQSKKSRFSGAFILIRRTAYEAIGGHAAVRAEIMEDMALAQRMKATGRPIRLVYTHDLSRTRMYDRLRDAWQGLTRFAYPMLHRSPWLLAVAGLATFFGVWMPWVALVSSVPHSPPALGVAGLGLILAPVWGLSYCYRVLGVPRRWALLLVVSATLMWMAAAWSAWCHHSGRGVTWKNRRYSGPPEGSSHCS